jgi:hypothetical protein
MTVCLPGRERDRISAAMRATLLILLLLATPAWAQQHASRTPSHTAPHAPSHPATTGPKSIGKFEDWQAATMEQAGQPACYAFVRANNSNPKLPGRGDVVLTVTERPGGRDAVAISAGYAYPANAELTVQVDRAALPFYTAQRSAFARDGHIAVEAFQGGREAVAKGPGPHGTAVSDTFSLRGFSAAYAAITKACPAK